MDIIIIPKHFNGYTTLIIGDTIINGSTAYDISELDVMYTAPEYSIHHINTLKKELAGLSTIYTYPAVDCINHNDGAVRLALATYGNTSMHGLFIFDKCYHVRAMVAKLGTNEQRKVLLHDKHWFVRYTVARYGTDSNRYNLLNDIEWTVRRKSCSLLRLN